TTTTSRSPARARRSARSPSWRCGAGSAGSGWWGGAGGPGPKKARGAGGGGAAGLVLVAGSGEPESERAEDTIRESGADLTIVRSTWFAQNFSEDYWRDLVGSAGLPRPARDVPEPFVDADDIADVAVAALTDDRHIGELYELTG